MNQEPKIETKREERPFVWILPACCKEARDDCPHVSKKYKEKKKRNIAL